MRLGHLNRDVFIMLSLGPADVPTVGMWDLIQLGITKENTASALQYFILILAATLEYCECPVGLVSDLLVTWEGLRKLHMLVRQLNLKPQGRVGWTARAQAQVIMPQSIA